MTAWLLRFFLVLSGVAVAAGMACLAYRCTVELLAWLGLDGAWLAALVAGPLPAPDWWLALALIAAGAVLFLVLLLADLRAVRR